MKCHECYCGLDMAQIPYIEHQKRMFKAYQAKKRLKWLLIGSNILWSIGVALLLTR